MAQKFFTPLSIRSLSSVASDGLTVLVDGDSDPRIKIEAGGRITWGDGTTGGDTNLYRTATNSLKTDDVFEAAAGVVTVTTSGAPTAALNDGAIAVDTDNDRLYLRSNSTWFKAGSAVVELSTTAPASADEGDMWFDTDDFILYVRSGGGWVSSTGSTTLESLNDVNIPSPSDGEVLQYDGTAGEWVAATFSSLPAGGDTGQVLSKTDGTDYNVEWADVISADGGTPSTWTRVLVAMDAGGV